MEATLAGASKHVVIVEGGRTNDLAQDLLEVLTSACGRLYGRRSARDQARRVLKAIGYG